MASSTQTQTIEAHELPSTSRWESNAAQPHVSPPKQDDNDHEQPPTEPPSTLLDRATTIKLVSACFSFFVAGVNDGSIGALIPYIIRDYHITTAIVSSTCVSSLSPHPPILNRTHS